MKRSSVALAMLCARAGPAVAADGPRNVLLFVADGLRPGMVTEQTAPTIAALWKQGVRFTNTHSMFPTFTTANASAMATGHKLGDTGDLSNTIDA
jgi:arylsulfatase A-like enzyme